MNGLSILVLLLIVVRWAVQWALEALNQRYTRARAEAKPEAFQAIMDAATYAKSIQYTLSKSRFSQGEDLFQTGWLLVILFSGLLPWSFRTFAGALGLSAWSMAAYLFLVVMLLGLPGLPWDWYHHFRLEARFGFNRTTPKTWWLDRLKGLLLLLALGFPLTALILKIVDWTGSGWWLWAWTCLTAFQLIMTILAPSLILPLFNKFTPLPDGDLRQRLLTLAERTNFQARSIQVMDGSRRSSHSNAFFTGFGRFRKIVLFDTLIQQLTAPELEAVLAHEIGHYRKKHVLKMLIWSVSSSLVLFCALGFLARQSWFFTAFGFSPGPIAPALLLFGLLSGQITFWLEPLANLWLRRHEYEADRFAVITLGETDSLKKALRKLTEKNLANLTPHPLYSGFYYSHPTLLERESALDKGRNKDSVAILG